MKKLPRLSLLLISSFFLGACAPPPEEAARERMNLAKAEDKLAECRLFTQQKNFADSLQNCESFLKKDDECSLFPEQKEGCIAFVNEVGYMQRRQDCLVFDQTARSCEKLIKEKFHSYTAQALNFITQKEEKSWIERAKSLENDILIGVVRSGYGGKKSFLRGVRLAVKETNEQGGVLGRQLNIVLEESYGDLDISRDIAERMRDNPRIRAVIGRQFSFNTIPVTSVYEDSQIVYLSVSATMRNVIRYGNRLVFRLLPNSSDFSKALLEFCIRQKYHRLALLYSRDSYNEELAYAFRDYAVERGLNIVFEKSFFSQENNFSDISADMKELDIDGIFLTAFSDTAIHAIQDMRNLGITTPVIGSEALDSDIFAERVGNAGNGLVVPSIYNPFSKRAENASFVNAFRNAYGYNPDTWGAQGYDAVKLLVYAINEAKSTIPANIATALRYMPPQQRASGEFVFETSGELKNKALYFKELQNGRFILFKDRKQEEEQSKNIEIINDRIFQRPEKPSESTEAMSVL